MGLQRGYSQFNSNRRASSVGTSLLHRSTENASSSRLPVDSNENVIHLDERERQGRRKKKQEGREEKDVGGGGMLGLRRNRERREGESETKRKK